MRFGFLAVAAAAFMAMVGTAQAAPVLSLYNTGVDASGNALAIGSVDSHYTYGSYSGYDYTNYLNGYHANTFSSLGNAVVPTGFTWGGLNNSKAEAISFSQGTGSGQQQFTYRTTFDTTGVDISNLVINYQAYFDDGGEIAVNGVLITSTFLHLQGPTAGTLSGVFANGINTLDFVTFNQGGAGGMFFQVTSITGTGVPAPAALALLLLGLPMIVGMRKRATHAA